MTVSSSNGLSLSNVLPMPTINNSKPSASKKYKKVEISWGDAFIDTDDFTLEEAKATTPVYRTTVGFLIAKNQHGYVLSTDVYTKKEDGFSAKMFIPKGMVNEVKVLT